MTVAMPDNTSKTISTSVIWVSFAVVVAFGLCRMNFGDGKMFILALIILCVAAVAGTAIVWFRRSAAAPVVPPRGFDVMPQRGGTGE